MFFFGGEGDGKRKGLFSILQYKIQFKSHPLLHLLLRMFLTPTTQGNVLSMCCSWR